MRNKKSVLMTLNHNCDCSNEAVTGIAGNDQHERGGCGAFALCADPLPSTLMHMFYAFLLICYFFGNSFTFFRGTKGRYNFF